MESEILAYLGDNKEIYLLNSNGIPRQLTYPLAVGEDAPSLWPTWSSDGEWVAYFQPNTDRSPARLCITQANGVEMRVLVEMHDRMPIYVYWGPTNDRLAVVEQTLDGVELLVYFLDGREPLPLDNGAPIFFDWLLDGQSIVAHVVDPLRQSSRLQRYFLDTSQDDVVLSEETGGFAVPILLNETVIYAERKAGRTVLQQVNLQTESTSILGTFDGMLGMQLHPNQQDLALSVSNPETGSFVLQTLNLRSGDLNNIPMVSSADTSIQSMFWSRCGQQLLMTVVNATKRWVEWQCWDGTEHTVINQFLPTREQLFYLHFFEQFSRSHNIFSSDGQTFYFAGYEPPHRRTSFPPKSWVFRGRLQTKCDFEPLQIGLFPVLSPRYSSAPC